MGHNKPWRSKKYRDFIRFKPCERLDCNDSGPCDPHHVSVNDQGWGTKPADSQCLPLCRACHGLEESGHGIKADFSDVILLKKMLKYMAEFITKGGNANG